MKITYDKYVSFINQVVENTIADGLEYKNFYLALMFALLFTDYEIVNENDKGNIDIVKEWESLGSIKFNSKEGKEISLTDFVCSQFYDTSVEIPININVYYNMVNVINSKLDNYYQAQVNITPLHTSLSILLDTITEYVTSMENKFNNADLTNIVPLLTDLTKDIKNMDKKAFSETLANRIHENNIVTGGKNDK